MTPTQERAHAYVSKMPPSIQGSGGSKAAFEVALALMKGFAFTEEEAFPIIADWNQQCQPPWSKQDLCHKLKDALEKSKIPFGYLSNYDKPRGSHRIASRCSARPLPNPISADEGILQARVRLSMPPLHRGTLEEIETVARNRNLCFDAVSLAQCLPILAFGDVCGNPCWILTDASRKCAEARRMDGQHFSSYGSLVARKAHTLKGSSKSWPIGVEVLKGKGNYKAIMLVEGGPDYLAALHFACMFDRWDVLPVAMLGRGAGNNIAPEALQLLKGYRVRIYPHNDADGGGMANARKWAAQLHIIGCPVDIYPFSRLTRTDGQPVNDLNDAALIATSQQNKITTLLP